jgi:hypothetical protein
MVSVHRNELTPFCPRLRHLRRFESYCREIAQIEMIASGQENDPAAPMDATSLRAYLEQRLTALKCQVLHDFAAGGLQGEGLMAGIIALVNDTRKSLAGKVAAPGNRSGARAREACVNLTTWCCPRGSAQSTGRACAAYNDRQRAIGPQHFAIRSVTFFTIS